MTNTYPVNTEIVLTGDFSQVGDGYVDPTTVTMQLTNPSGVETTLSYPANISRTSQGVYTYTFTPTLLGQWTYVWQGTGSVQVESFANSFIIASTTPGGTYNFNPSIGEIVLYAYNRIGIRRTAILQEHMADARMAMNFMLAEWANRGVNLWKVQFQSIALTQGVATYAIPGNCAMMLDAVIETQGGTSNPIDRFITPMSRSEYNAQPNKLLQAPPTLYWYDRTIAPTVTLWPVPDGNGPYLLNYYMVSQMQDANYAAGQTPDVPYVWLRALASGLEAELCPSYAPEREMARRADAERSFQIAAEWNIENSPIYIAPMLSGYFR